MSVYSRQPKGLKELGHSLGLTDAFTPFSVRSVVTCPGFNSSV